MIGSLIPVSFPQAGKEGKAGEHQGTRTRTPPCPPCPAEGRFNYGELGQEKVSDAFVCFTPRDDNCPDGCPREKGALLKQPSCGCHGIENESSSQVEEGAEGLL